MDVMPARISVGKVLHQLGVFVDQRLALGAVGDHEFHLRLRFDVGGKPGAAGATTPYSRNFSLSIRFRIAGGRRGTLGRPASRSVGERCRRDLGVAAVRLAAGVRCWGKQLCSPSFVLR